MFKLGTLVSLAFQFSHIHLLTYGSMLKLQKARGKTTNSNEY